MNIRLKTILLTLVAATRVAFAATDSATFLVDFGPAGRTTTAADHLGRQWNNVTSLGPLAAAAIKDISGSTAGGVTLAIPQQFGASSLNGLGSEVVYTYTAASDFFYVQRNTGATSPVASIALGGLDTTGATVYDVKFFTSSNRQLPQKYITEFTVLNQGDARVVELEAVRNDRNIARIDGLAPRADGTLAIEVRVGADSDSGTVGFGGIGVLELVARAAGSEPSPDEPVRSVLDLGGTPNPPAEASDANPEGLRAYVWETADPYLNRAGAAELLRRAGFHVEPLPLDRPPYDPSGDPEDDVDLIFIGSFVSDSPEYAAYMAEYADYLDDYIDRAGFLVQMTQNDSTEYRPPFLPDTQDATRVDNDFQKAIVLSPDHPLMANIPLTEGEGAGAKPTFSYLLRTDGGQHGTNTIWEAFGSFAGFEVIVAGDERARFPGLMEGAYGQGRFLLAAMGLDKVFNASTGEEVAPESMAAFNAQFFKNLYDYTALVRDRATPPITLTPQPGEREVSDGAWTLVLLPDTQIYSQNYPGLFSAQTSWIRDNLRRYNIRYVLHLGDITNTNSVAEWKNARGAMAQLDNVVPYAFVTGNHDHGPGGNAATRDTHLNSYFKYETYASWPTFGGAMVEGDMQNTYHLFNAGGVQWIVLCLEWAPRNEVVDWANTIMERYPDRKGILVTHAFMNNTNWRYDINDTAHAQDYNPHHYTTPGTMNDGEELWQKLVRKHNFVMTVNGHVLGSGVGYRVDNNDAGQPVHQMLSNYQMRTLGGEGYLRLIQFQPDGRTVKVQSYSPVYDGFLLADTQDFSFDLPLGATDSNGDGIFDYYAPELDSNGNGISNYDEYVLHGTDPWADGAANYDRIHAGDTYESITGYVKENPARFDLYTESMLAHLYPESRLLRAADGKATLQVKVRISDDLKTWRDADAAPVEWETDLPDDKVFYRIELSR
ncbi:metallophosphoesterase [Opitutaceae bacterium TAV5]|nr:metallophosphoesterase [Opitutaceae bacterium TAV5]